MIRAFTYIMFLAAAIFAVLYSTAGKERETAEHRRNCAEQPTEKCLAQAASALGTKAVNEYYVGVVVDSLMRMGYIEEAQSLSRRSGLPKPVEVEQQFPRGYFALSAALQKPSVEPVTDVLQKFIAQNDRGLTDSTLYLAALELLKRKPNETFVAYNAQFEPVRDTRAWEAAFALTKTIEELPAHENPRVNARRAVNTMQLYRMLDMPEKALASLQRVDADVVIPSWEIGMLARSLGALRVAEVLQRGEIRVLARNLSVLAGVAFEQGEAGADIAVLLKKAAMIALSGKRTNWDGAMRAVVLQAHLTGNDELAAYELDQFYQKAKENSAFPWFAMIEVAGAYGDIGQFDIALSRLEEAIEMIPADKQKTLAVGLVGGAYSFGSWGLDRETYVLLASEYARLGKYDLASYYLALIDERVRFAWQEAYRAQDDMAHREQVFALADKALDQHDMVWLLSDAARWAAMHGELGLAKALGKRALSTIPENSVECEACYSTYAALLIVAHKLGDYSLAKTALRGAAQSALFSERPVDIVKTALHWHELFANVEL